LLNIFRLVFLGDKLNNNRKSWQS